MTALVSRREGSRDEIAAAVEAADLRVLLMCLVHMTGDLQWLDGIYQPVRDVGLVADETAGLSMVAVQNIRSAARKLLAGGRPAVALPRPDDQLLQRMMCVCLSENVADEYVAMMREDMGFAPRDVTWRVPPSPAAMSASAADPIVIIGAGFSGLGLAAKFEQLGLNYVLIEKNADVGGTWLENKYPGCRVDVPNHFYSYSFRPNHQWEHHFAKRDEVQSYIERCADEFGVRAKIRFKTEVVGATWNEERCRWLIDLRDPEGGHQRLETRFLVSAIGQLNLPSVPTLSGAADFEGEIVHSACWPDALDVAGKHVAVIGAGASAVQIIPSIAPDVARLSVFQRSPHWARRLPEYDHTCPPGTEWLLDNVPFYDVWLRFTLFWRYGDGLHRSLHRDPDWPHQDRSINQRNEWFRQELTEHLEQQLAGRPDLIAKCLPSYPPWGKRMLVDNGWFQTLRRDNVDLVDDLIDHLDATGIVTSAGEHFPADIIVFATGFKVTDMTARLSITGQGRTLAQAWANDNPTAYLGITVPDFPNMFILYGPNTNLAHGGSAIFMAECQTRYITSCIVQMLEASIDAIDCQPEVHDRYVGRVDAAHEHMVWTHPGMSNWYRNQYGRVFSLLPWRCVDYWAMTHDADLTDYRLTCRDHTANAEAPNPGS